MLNVSDKFLVSYGILLEWRKQFKRGIPHNCPHRPQVLKKRDEEMIKKRNQGREDKKLQALMTKCNHARKWIATRRHKTKIPATLEGGISMVGVPQRRTYDDLQHMLHYTRSGR